MAESNSEVWHDLGKMFSDLRFERRTEKEDSRVEYAKQRLSKLGYETRFDEGNRCLLFALKSGSIARIWPYTGWWSGKGIGSDRGIKKLIKNSRRLNNEHDTVRSN